MKKIDKERKRLIQSLKEKGENRNQISKILKFSWATVDKYWNEEPIEEKKDEIEQPKEKEVVEPLERKPWISPEVYKKLYKLLDEGKNKVEVIKETGLADILDEVCDRYYKDKGVSPPENVLDNIQKFSNSVLELKEEIKKMEKKIDGLHEKIKKVERAKKEILDDKITRLFERVERLESRRYLSRYDL